MNTLQHNNSDNCDHDKQWLMNALEVKFGPLEPLNSDTFTTLSGNQIRALVVRAFAFGRFQFQAGEGSFDILAFTIEGTGGIWLITEQDASAFPRHGQIVIDNVDHPEGWRTARIVANDQNIKLKQFLFFSKNASKSDARELTRLRVNVALIGEKLSRARGRLETDADFASLFARVTVNLGQLRPVDFYRWAASDNSTIHFTVSKPLHGMDGRAFFGYSISIKKCTWLAVTVRGHTGSWLIPTDVISQYLQRLSLPIKTELQLGFNGDQDYLWAGSFDVNSAEKVGEYRLDKEALFETAKLKKLTHEARELEALRRKHAKKLTVANHSLTNDDHQNLVYGALSKKFGPLELLSYRPGLCRTESGQIIRFASYMPWSPMPNRMYFDFTADWLDTNWIALSIRGSNELWIIPTPVLRKAFGHWGLTDPIGKTKIFAGMKDGEHLLWMRNAEGIDLSNYRTSLHNPFATDRS
jgi:hypothetical protein